MLQLWATLGKVGNWWIYFAMLFGVLTISFNRLTAMVWPVKYQAVCCIKRSEIYKSEADVGAA